MESVLCPAALSRLNGNTPVSNKDDRVCLSVAPWTDRISALSTVMAEILSVHGATERHTRSSLLLTGVFPFNRLNAAGHKTDSMPGQQESYLGSLAPVIRSIQQERGFPLAYENRGRLSVAEWRNRGRAAIDTGLSYAP